ncbi:hypothetical protein P3S67_015355 [Capsicum chacoense]
MNINRSPGPEGYESGFFRAVWHIVGPEVCDAIKDFFQNDKLLKQLNATVIFLIPKIEKPEYASQFRPIS